MRISNIAIVIIILCILFLSTQPVNADVLFPGTKVIERCVKIDNIGDFPDVVFVGYIRGPVIQCKNSYVIDTDECLTQFYKANDLTVYAVEREYFERTGLENISFDDEHNHPGYTFDLNVEWDTLVVANPLTKEKRYYSIAGSNDTDLILYESKRLSTYVGGVERVQTFDRPDIDGLSLTLGSSMSDMEDSLNDEQEFEASAIEQADEGQQGASPEQENSKWSVLDNMRNFFKGIFGSSTWIIIEGN
ncbi:hypothetical protein [Methanolobus sp. WCC4]|uniref:hypothetical protein n=1 Tax=Methanolobus sp. WCC4 TaxID=3125784 RepID=UPI0030F81799